MVAGPIFSKLRATAAEEKNDEEDLSNFASPPAAMGKGLLAPGAIAESSWRRCVLLRAQVEGDAWHCHAGSRRVDGKVIDTEDPFPRKCLEIRTISKSKSLGPWERGRAKDLRQASEQGVGFFAGTVARTI